jgi:hypothetical protein
MLSGIFITLKNRVLFGCREIRAKRSINSEETFSVTSCRDDFEVSWLTRMLIFAAKKPTARISAVMVAMPITRVMDTSGKFYHPNIEISTSDLTIIIIVG